MGWLVHLDHRPPKKSASIVDVVHKRDRVARSAEPSGRADPGKTILPHAIEIYGCIPSPDYFVDYTISKRNSSVLQLLVKNCPVIDEVKLRVNFGFQSRVKF